MKKWYRNNIVKVILTGLAHVVSVVLIIALLWIFACPSAITDVFTENGVGSYMETEGFSDKVFRDSIDILNDISWKEELETEGKIDKTRIVDVKAYDERNIITGENESGIAYTIDELVNWADAIMHYECSTNYYGDRQENPIVVCQKEDGSYEYFYYTEFHRLVGIEELHLVLGDAAYSEQEILDKAKEGTLYSDNDYLVSILDKERRIKYTDCWSFDGVWIEEMYAPQGAASILDIVNTDSRWNGKLSAAFEMIYDASCSLHDTMICYEENMNRWDEGNTNLSYIYADLSNKTIYTNRKEYEDFEKINSSIDAMKSSGTYAIVRPTLREFETNMETINAEIWLKEVKNFADSDEFVYAVVVDATLPIPDDYALENEAFLSYAPYMTTMVILAIASTIILILCVVWFTLIAGRRPEDEELHLHAFDGWKTEIAAALVIGIWVICVAFGVNMWPPYYYGATEGSIYSEWQLIAAGFVAIVSCAFFLIGYLSLVRRIKARTLWRDSLTRVCVNWVKHFGGHVVKHVPALWKTLGLFAIFIILHWIAMAVYYEAFPIVLAILSEVAALFYVLNVAIGRKKIHKGIERIANGDVDYKIELEHLHGQQLEIAEMVNNIGDGLQAAVEKSMKSERLKTDLITNVSHDIKTPLTSIINYIDLLKRENFADPKVQGYLDILEAKAQRLKTLTEDVVEASKVSSGNISLEKMNINLIEMIQQTSGEFEEKFKNRGLKEILNLPDGEATVYVDGRRMWRVLENIYNNAAKYAMEGTRVYADLRVVGNEVIFSLKNISEQPLNIEADELTERFIRGDISRSSEGSGLGLSIAKNLTEMQGGKFELYLDGDLFKVTIKFPKC